MPSILVPSSAKRIVTQILVIAKLNEEKIIFWELLFVISFVPERNYLFKVSNLSTRMRCESCSMLKMSILTIFNISDVDDVVLVFLLCKCKHISNFVLTVDFEQTNV